MKQKLARAVSLVHRPELEQPRCFVRGCGRSANTEDRFDSAILVLEIPLPGASDLIAEVPVCVVHANATE